EYPHRADRSALPPRQTGKANLDAAGSSTCIGSNGALRIVVVGLGIQGEKRLRIAGTDAIATIDPVNPKAQYKTIESVPADSYDAALGCTHDAPKISILRHLLKRGKQVLVEKPLLGDRPEDLAELDALAKRSGAACYTAYNH